jgi:hypothetical protein
MRRFVSATSVVVLVVAVAGTASPAHAAGQMCFPRVPQSAAEFQSLADTRTRDWGVGDLVSQTDLPDGRRLFLFGDTGYYGLHPDGSRAPLVAFGNNSAWLQQGACFMLLDNRPSGGASWIVPPDGDGSVYWPGGAVVVGNRLHVFLARMQLNQFFGTQVGAAVATFELPSLEFARIAPIPFDGGTFYGGGAVYDGGYLYAYGWQDADCLFCAGHLGLARVREDLVQVPSAWQYAAGGSWSSDSHAARPVLRDATSQPDVQPYNNGFLLVTKPLNIFDGNVAAWWAPNPEGPWSALGTIYDIPLPPRSHIPGHTYNSPFTYMASLTPSAAVERGGMLLAYNVNTFDDADAQRDGRMAGPRFVSVTVPPTPPASPRPVVTPAPSPWEPVVGADQRGRVRVAGGNVGNSNVYTARAVGVDRTVTGRGNWVVASDGGIFSYGDAQFYGSTGRMKLNQPIVGMAATPTGRGYWLVASDGGVFSFGDAQFFGSTGGFRLNRPVVNIAATPTGRGYWLVASDGGVFSFGDAQFFGSTGSIKLRSPISDLAPSPSGRGYRFVATDGGVFSFGDAPFLGSAAGRANGFVLGITSVPGGYRLIDTAGTIHNFGAARGPAAFGANDAPYVGIS